MIFRIFCFSLIISLTSCSIGYYAKAGYHQARILINRKSISKALENDATDSELREKLSITKEARSFAKELELNPQNTFTTYSIVKNLPTIWVVTAAPTLRLQAYQWNFPLVGNLPYKGFFSKEDAEFEERRLKEKGYDTHIRTAAAYSTLGWFNDPVLPSTLELDHTSLFNTVVHEITHTTIWIPENVSFNETMAHTIGLLASAHYFSNKDEALFQQALKQLERECNYSVKFEKAKSKLHRIFESSITDKDKLKSKEEIYTALGLQPNNALFLSYFTYLEKFPLFMELYLKSGDLNSYIKSLHTLKKQEPFESLSEVSNSAQYNYLPQIESDSICSIVQSNIERNTKK